MVLVWLVWWLRSRGDVRDLRDGEVKEHDLDEVVKPRQCDYEEVICVMDEEHLYTEIHHVNKHK